MLLIIGAGAACFFLLPGLHDDATRDISTTTTTDFTSESPRFHHHTSWSGRSLLRFRGGRTGRTGMIDKTPSSSLLDHDSTTTETHGERYGGDGDDGSSRSCVVKALGENSKDVCPEGPKRKIIYIKTHKTGSSTLANLFHRAALKYGLRPALPTDNMFYGWPSLDPSRIQGTVYKHRETPGKTYDILCSGHVRFSAQALDTLVPSATYVTVLRSPYKHLLSSFRYWHVADHIRKNSGQRVGIDDLMEDFDGILANANPSDRTLLHNSQAFDLGLANTATPAELDRLISVLKERFIVLITDHMDESLVMMRRKLCWEMDDIVYLSLKSTGHVYTNPYETPEAQRQRGKIEQYNHLDTRLFNTFNQSLFDAMENDQSFVAEVAAFQRRRLQISERCVGLKALNERYPRKQVEETRDLSEIDRQCWYLKMDSIPFSMHFKRRVHGVGPGALECRGFGIRTKNAILVRTSWAAGTQLVASLILRTAINLDSRVALPAQDSDTTNEGRGGHNSRGDSASISGSRGGGGGSRLNRNLPRFLRVGSRRVPTGRLFRYDFITHDLSSSREGKAKPWTPITKQNFLTNPAQAATWIAVRNPIDHVYSIWLKHKCAELLEKAGAGRVSLGTMAKTPGRYMARLPSHVRLELDNGMARALGYVENEPLGMFMRRVTSMSVTTPFVAERPLESLVMMRRHQCLGTDFYLLNLRSLGFLLGGDTGDGDSSKSDGGGGGGGGDGDGCSDALFSSDANNLDPSTRAAIMKWQAADWMLYNRFNKTLDNQLRTEVGISEEVAAVRRASRTFTTQCQKISQGRSPKELLSMAKSVGGRGLKRDCALSAMDEAGLEEFVKENRLSAWGYGDDNNK